MTEILSTTEETLNGTVYSVQKKDRLRTRVVQVKITDTATVQLQGRMDSNFEWDTLKEFNQTDRNEIIPVQLTPQIRAVVASNNGTAKLCVDFEATGIYESEDA